MSKEYFTKLNYSLANEDSSLEMEVLPEQQECVLTIAGSGSRVLPLLLKNPKKLVCVDSSLEQTHITELRLSSLKKLAFHEYLLFWGYPGTECPLSASKRKQIFASLELSQGASVYLRGLFEKVAWETILYEGRWEKTFHFLSRLLKLSMEKEIRELFDLKSLDEQKYFFLKKWPRGRWSILLYLLGNKSFFNSFLYKGSFPRRNMGKSFFNYYSDAFNKIFNLCTAKENFFLQLLFLGKLLYPQGNPLECQKENYEKIKKSLENCEVNLVHKDIFAAIEENREKIDFLSFSDVPSYFSGELEKNFLQKIACKFNQDALVVVRSYLHAPQGLDLSGFLDVSFNFQEVIAKEKTQMYAVNVYRRL